MDDGSWFPKRPESEPRRRRAEVLYDLEAELRKIGWGDPAFVYDEEHDLFRFRDGAPEDGVACESLP